MSIVLVTGGKGNLGKYIIDNFSQKKCSIINLSRNINYSKKKNIENINCDLSKPSAVNKSLRYLKKKYKCIDLIIFCAGNSKKTFKKFETKKDHLFSLNSNFFSFTNLLENYLSIFNFKKTKIIVFSSIVANKITKAPITYSISKHALSYYCKIKAKELAKFDIKINTISPGNILMKNNNWMKKKSLNPDYVKKYIKSNVPLNSFCNPEQLLELCVYLFSRSGDNITGSNFIIDAGESIQ